MNPESRNRRRLAGILSALMALLLALVLMKKGGDTQLRREDEARQRSMTPACRAELPNPARGDRPEAGMPEAVVAKPAEAPASKSRGKIQGRITDSATGEPIAGAEVFGAPTGTTAIGFRATTGADGKYSVEVDARDWDVNARAGNFASFRIELEIRKAIAWNNGTGPPPGPADEKDAPYRVNVAAGGTATFDAALSRGVEIRGVVTDVAGKPLEGAAVRIGYQIVGGSGRSDPLVNWESTTDAAGRFTIGRFLPEGKVEVIASAPGYSRTCVWADVTAASPEVTVVLKPTLGFTGMVTDAHGVPIPGAFVFLDDAGWGKQRFEKSGEDGTFRIENPIDRCAWVAAWAPGHGWAGVAADPARGGFLTIVLPDASGEVRGVVKNEAGDPVAGARVVVTFLRRRDGDIYGTLAFHDLKGSMMSKGRSIALYMPEEARAGEATTNERGEFVLKGLAISDTLSAEIAVAKEGYCLLRQFVSSADSLEVSLTEGEGEDGNSDRDYGEMSSPPEKK